jgi:hypothetical protein
MGHGIWQQGRTISLTEYQSSSFNEAPSMALSSFTFSYCSLRTDAIEGDKAIIRRPFDVFGLIFMPRSHDNQGPVSGQSFKIALPLLCVEPVTNATFSMKFLRTHIECSIFKKDESAGTKSFW